MLKFKILFLFFTVSFFLVVFLVYLYASTRAGSNFKWSVNENIYVLASEYAKARPAQKKDKLAQLNNALLLRKSILQDEMRREDKLFFSHVFTNEEINILKKLIPATLFQQGLVEKYVDLNGIYRNVIIDGKDAHSSSEVHSLEYYLQNKRIFIELFFYDKKLDTEISGSKIKVSGIAFSEKEGLALSQDKAVSVIEPKTAESLGVKNTLVLQMNFPSNRNTLHTNEVTNDIIFLNPTSSSKYWLENSYQKIIFQGDVHGWFELSSELTPACSFSDVNSWADEADALARASGVDTANYDNFVYILPEVSNCNWGGIAALGGNRVFINYLYSSVIAHEWGHSLGLRHSNYLDCVPGHYDNYDGCQVGEYGGNDVMGNSGSYDHTHITSKRNMNLLSGNEIKNITRSGVYTIKPIETLTTSAPMGLMIEKKDTSQAYLLQYRGNTGFDADISDSNRITINVVSQDGGPTTIRSMTGVFLLTASITSSNGSPRGLQDGERFMDYNNGITIKLLSHTSDSATVEVSLPPEPTNTPRPIVTPTPSQNSGTAIYFPDMYPSLENNTATIFDPKATLQIKDAFTVEFWIRPEFDYDYQDVISYLSDPNDIQSLQYQVFLDNFEYNLGTVKIGISVNTPVTRLSYTSNVSIPADGSTWSHIAFTYKDHKITLYINGTKDSEFDINSEPTINTETSSVFNIAGYDYTSFVGAIDELRISSNVRPIEQLWQANSYQYPLDSDNKTLLLLHFASNLHDSGINTLVGNVSGSTTYLGGIVQATEPTMTPTPTKTPQELFDKNLFLKTAIDNVCSYMDLGSASTFALTNIGTLEFSIKPDPIVFDKTRGCSVTPILGEKVDEKTGAQGDFAFWLANCEGQVEARFSLLDYSGITRSFVLKTAVNSISSNQWSRIKLLRNNNTYKLLLNNTLQDSFEYDGNGINSGLIETFTVGTRLEKGYACFSSYTGKIDELRISDIARENENDNTPSPFVDDLHTTGLWHFDGNLNDSSISNSSSYMYGSYSFSDY